VIFYFLFFLFFLTSHMEFICYQSRECL
jgi:hypothetical protein